MAENHRRTNTRRAWRHRFYYVEAFLLLRRKQIADACRRIRRMLLDGGNGIVREIDSGWKYPRRIPRFYKGTIQNEKDGRRVGFAESEKVKWRCEMAV